MAILKSVCCVCKKRLSEKEVDIDGKGKDAVVVSHGYCKQHLMEFMNISKESINRIEEVYNV